MSIKRVLTGLIFLVVLTSCNVQNLSSAKPEPATKLDALLSAKNKREKAPVALNTTSKAKDKTTCLAKADEASEAYYQCRAQLLRDRVAANDSILKKLTPTQRDRIASWEQQAQNFEAKAKETHQNQIETSVSSRETWEKEQAEVVGQAEAKDNRACTQKGFSQGKMENPDTEAYFDCRAVLAAKRVAPPPSDTGYNKNQLPKAVLAFYRKAEEAKQAFNARDYQDHYTCLDKGLFPGPLEESNTAAYYRCRADLAKTGLGKIVHELFLEDYARAKKEGEAHSACTLRHYQPSSPEYSMCRKAYTSYKLCKEGIRSQVATREARDRRDCSQNAQLQYPKRLSQSHISEYTRTNANDNEIRTKTVQPAKYSTIELERARSSATSICMHDKEIGRAQFRIQLEYQCGQIMDNIAQQGGV